MCGFEPGMKLEVPNQDYRNTYWLATIIAKAPPLILVRFEGFQETNNQDFWCNTLSDDIHPVGWCAKTKHALKPPKSIQHKEKNWYAYLIKNLTGARKASESLFDKKSHPAHYLRAGQYVEVLDPYNPTCYWLAKIMEVFSGRLNLQYEGWDEVKQEFWCYYLHEGLRPVGFGIRNGLILYPPKGAGAFTHTQFSRLTEKLLALSKRSDNSVFKSLFVGWTNKKEHNLRIGMKLEAVHPNDQTSICVASVARIFDQFHFLVKIDNLLSTQDDIITNSFVAHKEYPYIFPIGFCSKNGVILNQPRGYNGKFSWDGYLKYTKSEPIPLNFFTQEMPKVAANLEDGMKLEAVDKDNPANVCVCTISRIVGHLIWLNIDGDTRSDQIFDVNSYNIFPVGWCEATGHELQWPRPNTLEQKNRISSLRQTATRQNRLQVLRKGKLREKSKDDTVDLTTKGSKRKDKRAQRQYGRRGVSRQRVVYEENDEASYNDTSIAIVCINRLAEEYNSEDSIKQHFRLDSNGKLPAEIVTIDDDDDSESCTKATKSQFGNKSKYTAEDLNYLSFIKVKPKDLTNAEDEFFQQKLKENDGNQGTKDVSMLSPNTTNRESRRSLNSVVAMLRASRQQRRTHLTQLEQYKQNKAKKAETSSENVKSPEIDRENTKQVIDLSNDDDVDMTKSQDQQPYEKDGAIQIPGKGEYRIVEKIVTKQGGKNKIVLKLGKPVLTENNNTLSNIKVSNIQSKSASMVTTPVSDMHLLSNMARTHPGVDEIMRNRFLKVRSFCKDLPKNPLHWTKKHVASFVQNCDLKKYAKIFFDQDVDGHSLLLLTVQEIHHILGVHVGPAMKLHDYIYTLQQLVNDAYISNSHDDQGGSNFISKSDIDSIILETESTCQSFREDNDNDEVMKKEAQENESIIQSNVEVARWIDKSISDKNSDKNDEQQRLSPTIINKLLLKTVSEATGTSLDTLDQIEIKDVVSKPACKPTATSVTLPVKDNKGSLPKQPVHYIPTQNLRILPSNQTFIPHSQNVSKQPVPIMTNTQAILSNSQPFFPNNQTIQFIQYRPPGIQIAAEFPAQFGPHFLPLQYIPEQAKENQDTDAKYSTQQTNLVNTNPVSTSIPIQKLVAPHFPTSVERTLYQLPSHILTSGKDNIGPPAKKLRIENTLPTIPFRMHPVNLSGFSTEHPAYKKFLETVDLELLQQDLWEKFHSIGTEMILTRLGRRMFPNLQVRINGMESKTHYVIMVEFIPADHCRYKYEYEGNKWSVACDENTPTPARVYVHPESPATGEEWMKNVVDFTKCKLTNDISNRNGHILMHSMHKYQPRIQIIYWDNKLPLQINPLELLRLGCRKEIIFPETSFIAVTAYQNSQITQLKIESNPFARGFRGDWRENHKKRKKQFAEAQKLVGANTGINTEELVQHSDDAEEEEESDALIIEHPSNVC